MLTKGCQIEERYSILREIDTREGGTAYEVRDEREGQRCVMWRFVSPHIGPAQTDEWRRSYHEALEIISAFEHADLPAVLDSFADDESEYLVIESSEGVGLETMVKMGQQKLPLRQIVRWGQQICFLLEYLHRRPTPFVCPTLTRQQFIVHTSGRVKITDFGLDQLFAQEGGLSHSTERDFVRFGELLFYLVTARPAPKKGLFPQSDIDPPVFEIIKRCMEHEKNPQYKSWSEVREQLEAVLQAPKVPAPAKAAEVADLSWMQRVSQWIRDCRSVSRF